MDNLLGSIAVFIIIFLTFAGVWALVKFFTNPKCIYCGSKKEYYYGEDRIRCSNCHKNK